MPPARQQSSSTTSWQTSCTWAVTWGSSLGTGMKNLARIYVWWPHIDKDIGTVVKSCYECQQTHHSPPITLLHPWEWPQRPWARIHIDYAGPVKGKMLLVIVDAHSKGLDIAVVTLATSSITIDKLRGMFATQCTYSLQNIKTGNEKYWCIF